MLHHKRQPVTNYVGVRRDHSELLQAASLMLFLRGRNIIAIRLNYRSGQNAILNAKTPSKDEP